MIALLLPLATTLCSAQPIVLENELCRWEIAPDGNNRAFINRATGQDYCEPGPFMVVHKGGRAWPSAQVQLAQNVATVSFGDAGIVVTARLEALPGHFRVTVERVAGEGIEWLRLCNLVLKITANVGTLVNAAWDDSFGACVLACNDRTNSRGGDSSRAVLLADCYPDYGLEGARVAVLGTPTGGPDPAMRLLEAIGRVELAEGLPHPMLDGTWIKEHPARFDSYLMVHDLGERNVDEVVEFARGGFGCVEFYPWRSTPSYGLNAGLFPRGLEGLKECADKIHAAGLGVGIHVMQGMVGWGAKDDPYIVPRADPRLLQDPVGTLSEALDEVATSLSLQGGTAGWPDKGDLLIEGEIIRYTQRTETGFTDCQRGLWGTTVSAHPAGAKVGYLVNCFPIWGGTVYCPDLRTNMVEEICDRIAAVFNHVGADMSYFDGGEEAAVQKPQWRNQGRVALGVQARLRKPVILEGNALYTHLSWHVISRGSPHYDPIYFGRREYTLRFKGTNPAGWARNLLTGDVGWFAPHTHSATTDAVTPDEVLLLCLKALGGKAPISFAVSGSNLWANKRMPEMQEIIRACDELKRRDYFTEQACAELTRPRAEHTLEQRSDGHWELRPLQFGPPLIANAENPDRSRWRSHNPYAEQRPWVRIRARARLASFGSADNTVLADPAGGIPFTPVATASGDLTQAVEPTDETAPDGSRAFCWKAHNRSQGRSGWAQLSASLPQPTDLTTHRRLGLWLKANACGGILNVQLATTDARRDHHIALDFAGWRYVELEMPDEAAHWDYTWPYPWTDLFYTCQPVYSTTRQVNLFLNGLPAGAQAECLVGRIEALKEIAAALRSPGLATDRGQLRFPVTLQPDEYLELDWSGRCRHFEPNGGLLGEVTPEGELVLAPGDNQVTFLAEPGSQDSQRAEITLAVRGAPLPDARRPDAVPSQTRYSSLLAQQTAAPELRLAHGTEGRQRVLLGSYELVGGHTEAVSLREAPAAEWRLLGAERPRRAVLVISCGASGRSASYHDPRALTLESFDDATPYQLGPENQYEKYVVGGGKVLKLCGPVREGVEQSFAVSEQGARVGARCAVYSATNTGPAGGWSGIGRRFIPPVDLSAYPAVALWVCGDGKGETLRFQFRDTAGRHADWTPRVDFTGWRLMRFDTADWKDFNWQAVEYVLFYFNDIPAATTCTLCFDDLRALPVRETDAELHNPAVTVNGRALRFAAVLRAGDSLTLDPWGRCGLWHDGAPVTDMRPNPQAPLVLQAGDNRLQFTCDQPDMAPDEVTIRVIPVQEAH